MLKFAFIGEIAPIVVDDVELLMRDTAVTGVEVIVEGQVGGGDIIYVCAQQLSRCHSVLFIQVLTFWRECDYSNMHFIHVLE